MIELGDKFLEKATTKLHLYLITIYYYYKELYSHPCLAKNLNIFVSWHVLWSPSRNDNDTTHVMSIWSHLPTYWSQTVFLLGTSNRYNCFCLWRTCMSTSWVIDIAVENFLFYSNAWDGDTDMLYKVGTRKCRLQSTILHFSINIPWSPIRSHMLCCVWVHVFLCCSPSPYSSSFTTTYGLLRRNAKILSVTFYGYTHIYCSS